MNSLCFATFEPLIEYFDPFKVPFSGNGMSLFSSRTENEISNESIESCSACSACTACSACAGGACGACTACGSWN